jgi:hypothetical protein
VRLALFAIFSLQPKKPFTWKQLWFPLARIIHEYRREAAETEAWRGFSQVRATQADLRSVEETEREKPRQAMESAAVAGIHELSGLGICPSHPSLRGKGDAGRCEAADSKKPEAYSREYVEDFIGPRTTQVPADRLPQPYDYMSDH